MPAITPEEGWLVMKKSGLPDAARRFLKSNEVEERTSLSRSTRWRRIKEKTFPAPVRISKGRVAWLEHEIEAWINDQLARPARG